MWRCHRLAVGLSDRKSLCFDVLFYYYSLNLNFRPFEYSRAWWTILFLSQNETASLRQAFLFGTMLGILFSNSLGVQFAKFSHRASNTGHRHPWSKAQNDSNGISSNSPGILKRRMWWHINNLFTVIYQTLVPTSESDLIEFLPGCFIRRRLESKAPHRDAENREAVDNTPQKGLPLFSRFCIWRWLSMLIHQLIAIIN